MFSGHWGADDDGGDLPAGGQIFGQSLKGQQVFVITAFTGAVEKENGRQGAFHTFGQPDLTE